MKPSFALNFTDDAIGLLHRTSRGWLEVGTVRVDDPDLGQALAYLRGSALGLEPGGFTTKLVIPNSQIRYLTVKAPGPDAAIRRTQIKAALEGRTPYSVEDLVFDWSGTGTTVQVAVIARETLAEAEGFARDNRFNPISFVAIPEPGSFAAEPWFGATSLAPTLLAPGEKVERDQDPVRIAGRVPKADGAAAEPVATPQETDAAADEPAATAAPNGPEPAPAPPPHLTSHSLHADTSVAEEGDMRDVTPASPPASKPEVAAKMIDARVTDSVIEAEPAPEPPPAPAARTVSPLLMTKAVPPPALSAEASKPKKPPPPDKRPPAAKGAAKVADPRRNGPGPIAAPPRLTAIPGGGGARAEKLVLPEAEWPIGRVSSAAQSAGGKGETIRGGQRIATTGIAVAGARKLTVVPPARAEALADPTASRPRPATAPATPFGAQKARSRGKPRYLGVILTAILLAILAAIGLWSSVFQASRETDAPAIALVPEAASPGSTTAALSPTSDAPAPVTAPAPEAAAPTVTAVAAPPGSQAEPVATPPESTADVVPTGEAAPPADATASAPPAPLPAPAPVDAASLAAPGAQAIANATPSETPQDEIFLSLADPPIAPRTAALLAEPASTTDPAPAGQALPPPFGTFYQFDARGLIVPTPEGIITPEGVRLVAGKPPLVPPPRPAPPNTPAAIDPAPSPSTAPATLAQPAPAVTGAAEPPATPAEPAPAATEAAAPPAEPAPQTEAAAPQAADPALAGARPRLRPEAFAPQPATGPDQTNLTPAGGTRFSSLKPLPRPAGLTAEDAAPQTADAPAATQSAPASLAAGLNDSATSPLAVAVSRIPAARPRALDRAIETAVETAAAEPAPEPAPAPAPAATLTLALPEAPVRPDPVAPEPEATSFGGAASDDPALVELDEPSVGRSTSGAKKTSFVAKKATYANVLDLSEISLIGIFGSPSNRYAMVRQPTGRMVKVEVGDRIDGGRVAAISDRELSYIKDGRTQTLAMPRG